MIGRAICLAWLVVTMPVWVPSVAWTEWRAAERKRRQLEACPGWRRWSVWEGAR